MIDPQIARERIEARIRVGRRLGPNVPAVAKDEREAPAWELPPVDSYGDEPGALAAADTSSGGPIAALGADSKPALPLEWFTALQEVHYQPQIVKRLLGAGSLFVVFGESNSGKTFWILDLALAIAAGKSWRGRATRKGLVLYVAGEGAGSVRSRVAAYRRKNPDVDELPFAIIPQGVDLLDSASVSRLIETVRAAEAACGEKIAAIILDTFARSIPGADENSSQDVGRAIAAADFVRTETGAAVGFVHHAGKDPSKGARGSSALRAACDTEILIEGQSGQRIATATKQRDLETGEPMPFELDVVPLGIDEDGEPVSSCVVKHLDATDAPPRAATILKGKAQRQFLAAIRAHAKDKPGAIWTLEELREIGRKAGQHKNTARGVVDAIVTTPYMQATVGGYRFTDGAPRP